MNEESTLKFNFHMFIFINIITITIFNDILIYFTNINYNISLILVTILDIIFLKLSYKKIYVLKNDFEKSDIIPLIVCIILIISNFIRIDDFVDSLSYHLYNQKNPFIDKINFDLLPSSTFFFPLGDRMNYIFVNLLGYRFGSVLSSYILIILYYQMKNIIKELSPKMNTVRRTLYLVFILLSITSIGRFVGIYFIDGFSAVILLEMIYIFIKNINLFKSKKYLYFIVYLLGISTGIKITNFILGILIILFIIIKNLKESGLKQLKNIKIYEYVFLVILFLLPFVIYMLNNYIQTQNPIFPLLNNIFHSKYYQDTDGTDDRLGSNNILEFLFWPFFICKKMAKGDDILRVVDPIWGIGYFVVIYIICFYKKNNNKNLYYLSLLLFFMTLFWSKFILGYVRYGLVIAYAYYLVVICFLEEKFQKDMNSKVKGNIWIILKNAIFYYIFALLLILSLIMNIINLYWTYKNFINVNIENNEIVGEIINDKYDIDGVWLCTRYNNFYVDIIRSEEDPMYNLDIVTENDPMCGAIYKYSNFSKELFMEKINNKELYTVIPTEYFEYCSQVLEQNNLMIDTYIGTYNNHNIQNPYNLVYIVKLEYIK